MQMAGRMGWSEEQFWFSTPRYFQNACTGFIDQQREEQIEGLRRTRLAAFYSFLPHTKKGTLQKPEHLFQLPGESALKEFGQEEKQAMLAHLERVKSIDLFAGQSITKIEA